MTRLFLLSPLLLAACVEGMPADPKAPRMDQAGTCFAVVSAEEGGTWALTRGIGDGSKEPKGVIKRGMSAAQVDAAFAKEQAIMAIEPECLAVYAKDRTQAVPLPAPAPKA